MSAAEAVIGRWICMFSQPRHEETALASLQEAGFETYLPRYRTFIKHARKRQSVIRPLFSRYLFIRPQADTPLLWSAYRLKGVSGYAGQTLQNSIMRDELIDLMRSREDEAGMILMDFSDLEAGRRVKLLKGPLAGFEATFSERCDQRRSWIFVEFLGKTHRKRIENRDLELVL